MTKLKASLSSSCLLPISCSIAKTQKGQEFISDLLDKTLSDGVIKWSPWITSFEIPLSWIDWQLPKGMTRAAQEFDVCLDYVL